MEAIWRFTSERWGLAQADRYVDNVTDALVALAQHPLIAPTCDHIRRGYRRWPVERHLIYFASPTMAWPSPGFSMIEWTPGATFGSRPAAHAPAGWSMR
ncbi:type II toxin-antitoxin system RelE/ParE family toxin [Phenylobacterium sp.]|uniref:type II toxin-antitoxin system RelE/ParE family toxin n=1 Tax=Phenylobacterium sp. TaxID=1871053 RepID=UPI0025CEF26A|nr:type II toxin-antitoxin system RelE/ParE family toxin [Phenylobacterium sp.]